MDKQRLSRHIRLCRRNLASKSVKCCAECPFEEEITSEHPGLKEKFETKRSMLTNSRKKFFDRG